MTLQHLLKLSACGIIFGLAGASSAQAQTTPGSADPGRVQEQLQSNIDIPDLSQAVEVQRAVIQNAPANADKITFTLRELEIEGVSAYQDTDINSIYQSKLGQTVSLADIYAIANRLTNKYRNEGYILTQVVVPPQTIDGGQVKLRVVEGYVDRVIVDGEEAPNALALINKYANNISTGGALNLKDLEKNLLLINDLPGVTARSVLSPSQTQTGASDLRIIVSRKPYDAILGIDNFGSRFLGPVQLTAGASTNSFFGNNEQITAQFVSAPFANNNPELFFGSLSYEQPINSLGTKARAFFSNSDTEPGFTLDQFNVEGRSIYYGASVEHAFIRSRTRNLFASAQFDFRNVDTKSDVDIKREDRIRALRLGGRYEFLDTLVGVGINSIDAQFSQGFDILGSSARGDAGLTRPAGDPKFTKFNLNAQRLQRVTSDLNLLLGFSGQLSNNALLSSEEFGVGGPNYGRAYDPSEIVGEEGFATKVEFQWDAPINPSLSAVDDYELYSFWDFGTVHNDDATVQDTRDSLSSVGVGIRLDFANNFEGGFGMALPLTRNVSTRNNQDPRYFFNLNKRF